MITTEELDALDALRVEYVATCELERTALAIPIENDGDIKWRNVSLRMAHAAMNDAGVRLARAASDSLPRLLAEAREAATLRAKLAEVETQQNVLRHDMNELRDAAIEFAAAASVPSTTFAHARLQAAIEESR